MIKKFNRYELKYVINHKDYLILSEELNELMKIDPFAKRDGFYAISSRYYDTFGHEAYRSKVDGVMYRRKLRIRVYPEHEKPIAFVEIKQRINKTVQKRRICLSLEEADLLCKGYDIDLTGMDGTDIKISNEIRYLVKALHLRPACIISYRRKAYVGGRFDIGLRITFDLNLKYRIFNLSDISDISRNKYFMPPDIHIMEIKANERIPIWLTSFLAKHQCTFTRVSKYCTGLRSGLISLENKHTLT